MNTFATAPERTIDVFLQPGEYFVGEALHRIRTVLGSCVSVTLWNQARRIGAMSHFLLAARAPVRAARGRLRRAAPVELDARYGDEALTLMLRGLARREVLAAECQAKIFGGGNMFPAHKNPNADSVGQRNGEAARGMLQAAGIDVVSESLFGEGHRQIAFDIDTGNVWSRQVPPDSEFASQLEELAR